MPPADVASGRRGPSRRAPILLLLLAGALLIARVTIGIIDPPPVSPMGSGQMIRID